MSEPTTGDISAARDLLSTASALGLPVPAPVGVTVYYFRIASQMDSRRTQDGPHGIASIHTTYEGALAALAEVAIVLSDEGQAVNGSPWSLPEFYETVSGEEWRSDMSGWVLKHREAQDVARDAWAAEHTPQQIVDTLLRNWTIHTATIQA